MKRILIFNDSLSFGGTESLLVDILNEIADKECEATLLLPFKNDGDILLRNVSDKIKLKYIYNKKPSRIKKILHENLMSFFTSLFLKIVNLDLKKYDLIVCFKDSVYSIVFTKAKQKKILWLHNLPVHKQYGINSLKEYLPVKLLAARDRRLIKSYSQYDIVVCVSHAVMNNYKEIYSNGEIKEGQTVKVIYNAIDFSRIDTLSKLPIDLLLKYPTFIMATRFSVEKRIDRVIKAAKRLKEYGYIFKIIILGDGPYMKQIEDMVNEFALKNEISLLGYTANPYPYMRSSDWLICSSEKESFSLVILESIYLKTPVITTNCGGPTEISKNGEYTVLTENSSNGIFEGMKEALDNPDLSNKYTSKAKECLERFNYKQWLWSINQLLEID